MTDDPPDDDPPGDDPPGDDPPGDDPPDDDPPNDDPGGTSGAGSATGVEVENRGALATTPARETALACVAAGVDAARPDRAVRSAASVGDDRLRVGDREYDLPDRVVVLGGGKGAPRLAAGLESLGDRDWVDDGVVVTEEGDAPVEPDRVRVREASHPVPDRRGIEGSRELLAAADRADEDTLAVVALTGGASALLPAPAGGIDLGDLRAVTGSLLESGAPIEDVNAVRKHCSKLKGGLLARRLAPATVTTLAVSDVVGDDPSVVGSGPTVGDPTTYADALEAIDRHGVGPPGPVETHLRAGERGERPETPAPGDPAVRDGEYHVLANGETALSAAREVAADRGYRPLVLSARVRGDAAEAGRTHAAVAEQVVESGDPVSPPAVVLSGGETTVSVTGDGDGGPNAAFALAAGVELADGPPIRTAGEKTRTDVGAGPAEVGDRVALASVDTDGKDGPTRPPVAGAVVDGETVADPDRARTALEDDDAHGYLGDGSLVVTGATGTNVNDLRVVVVEAGTEG